MKKITDFKRITNKSQLKNNDYILVFHSAEIPDNIQNLNNIFKLNNKLYRVTVRKGLYENFKKDWKNNRTNNKKNIELITKFPDNEIFFLDKFNDGSYEYLSFPNVTAFLKDCMVFSYPSKVDINISNDDIMNLLFLKYNAN